MSSPGIISQLKQSKDPTVFRELNQYVKFSTKLAVAKASVQFFDECILRCEYRKHFWKILRRNGINPTNTALKRHTLNERDTIVSRINELELKRCVFSVALENLAAEEYQTFESYVQRIVARQVEVRLSSLQKQLNVVPQPTGGVTATVTLRNTGTSKLHYKLESTVPALYYFKPRYDSVCARQARSSEIFLLPFDFYHPENHKHELVVHIMLAQREEEENLRQLWEHNDQREILTRRVKCIPWVRGELAMEPNHELVFEGSFDVPFSSNLYLTNPSEDWMHFDIETSSTNLSVFPPDGTISGHNRKELIVIRKPLKSGDNTATNETIAIQSAVLPKSFWEPYKEKWSTVPKKNRTIKCVYNVLNTPSSLSDSKPVGVALLDPD